MQQNIRLIDRVQQVNNKVITAIEYIGVAALLLIMGITCADVIGAKMFLMPVQGSLDIVMLAQTVAISFSLAATLKAGGHVSVEIVLMHMPPHLKRFMMVTIELLSLCLFFLISWQLAVYGHELMLDGEVSPTAHIPIYPFAFGIATASIPACIELFIRIFKIITDKEI